MTRRSDMQPNSQPVSAPERDAGADEPEPPSRFPFLSVDVVMEDVTWGGFGDAEAAVRAAAAALAKWQDVIQVRSEAVVALATDAEVAELNATYRGKAKPTNVLSFPAPPLPGPPVSGDSHAVGPRQLGDIILARETILREVEESGTPPVHHLQHLVLHGLLHLLGYDHETNAEAERMEALETAILASMGIPDPYSSTLPASALDGEI